MAIVLRMTYGYYGIVVEPNGKNCCAWNSHNHVTTLLIAIPDAQISAVRFSAVRVVAERYLLLQLWLSDTSITAKVSEEMNRKCRAVSLSVHF